MWVTLCAVCILWLGGVCAAADAIVVQEWTFEDDIEGWVGVSTTPLKVEDGALVFEVTGRDVQIVSPLFELQPTPRDVLEIRIKSTTKGIAEWFWRATTEGQYSGFNADMRRSVPIEAGEEWQTLRIWPFWQGLDQIVGLRFDPPEGLPGSYAVASVRIVRFAEGERVAADFDFSTGDHGWVTLDEGAKTTPEGLRTTFATGDQRLISPALALDATSSPYIVVDVTAPAAPESGGRLPAVLEFATGDGEGFQAAPFWVAAGRRGLYNVRMARMPGWKGEVSMLLLGLARGAPGEVVLHALRAGAEPAGLDLQAAASGLEFQTKPWRQEFRLAAAPTRIDVATQAPPETRPVASDYTVAMWYFAAWEPEYTWDGWKQVAERSPWRMPLLYDSQDAEMQFNGIQFYRASNPRVVDWHVHWMREHAINLMLWDWYSRVDEDGRFDPGFFANRALEIGFLGKDAVGDPPVTTNRFAGQMEFAVMWTNHGPHHKLSEGLWAYIIDQFISQPNYYRLDGKPLLALWSVDALIQEAGGEEQAREALDQLRAAAKERGFDGIYIAAVNGASEERLRQLGIDGVTGYHYSGSGGWRTEQRRVGDRVVRDHIEDYPTQTIPGHMQVWTRHADGYGREYLLATTPMQNWEPTFRGAGPVMQNQSPDAYREMLRRAKAFIEERGLRRFVNIEAWNEWLEGSYVEPSTQWGLSYVEAIRDTFGRTPTGGKEQSR